MNNKKNKESINKLKSKIIIYVFITVFLVGIISNFVLDLVNIRSNFSPLMTIAISALINMVIIGIILYLVFDKIIGRALDNLTFDIEEIAQGNFSTLKEIKGIKEIPKISHSLKQIVDNSRKMAMGIRSNSDSLAQHTEELSLVIEETTVTVENIAQSVNEIAGGSEDTSTNIGELNQAISVLNSLSQDTDNYAGQAAELSAFMAESAQNGNQALDNIIEMVHSIKNNMGNTSETIDGLNEQIKNIDNIVLIINEIAEQTNLLALNAAIEAARAGDAGRGFAVVAEEISKLADATHSYSQEISTITQNITNSSTNAVSSVDEVIEVVETSVTTASSTKESFDNLLLAIGQLDSSIMEITKAAHEVRTNSQYILDRATEVSAISEETTAASETSAAAVESNLAAMEEINASIQNLANMAQDLHSIVDHVKI